MYVSKPELIYRTKEQMYPRFGFAVPDEQKVYVRSDLPECVKQFVLTHELHHLADDDSWWAWREVKANIHAARRHPFGFMACCLMSLTPYRLYYYLQRITGRQL